MSTLRTTAPEASGHIPTYYSASSELPAPQPALRGHLRADVCVVGGGIAGCSSALALAERGYRVVLLEAERIGWGASGRNGGQVIAGLASEQSALEALIGDTDSRRAWEISLEGIARLKQRIARHRIDCHWVDGQMLTAIKPRQWQHLQQEHERVQSRYGYQSTRLIAREELRATLATERYIGALYDANGGHLHPLRYTVGLARAAEAAGVGCHEGSPMIGYRRDGTRLTVRTPSGSVECDYLALAGNAWLGHTVPALERTLMTIASYLIATEPLGEERARALITNDAAVCDTNFILDYFRRSRDQRLLFGGRVNYSGLSVRAIAPATERNLLRVFPQLRGTRIDYAWGCLLDITLNRAPHFGRLAPNVLFLQGFSGHGLALAGIAGELLAEALAGTAERFDLFSRIPHRAFPGGSALRRPALALAMLWYRLRDLL